MAVCFGTVWLGACGATSANTLSAEALGVNPHKSDAGAIVAAGPVAAKGEGASGAGETHGLAKAPQAGHASVAARAAAKVRAASKPGSTAYRIGPLDVIEISVFKVPELSKVAQVSEIGTLNLPLVGEINAAGRSAREVEQELTVKLGAKYLRDPQVTVFVKEYNSQRVTIDGAVKRPGVYPIAGQMSLLQVIATAQGLTDVADATVVVFREVNGRQAAARFDVGEIRDGTRKDPEVKPGDVIVAGTSSLKESLNVLKVLPLAGLFALL